MLLEGQLDQTGKEEEEEGKVGRWGIQEAGNALSRA